MASEPGSTATEAPSAPSTTTVRQTTPASFGPVTDLTRQKSLKRARETTPTPQDPLASGGDISPSKIARLVGFARQSHPPLADEPVHDGREDRMEDGGQEHHHNHHHHHHHQQLEGRLEHGEAPPSTQRALDELMTAVPADMDRPHDAPSDTGQSEVEAAAAAAARALHSVNIPPSNVPADDDLHDVSPQSGTSGASLEDVDEHVVDSPSAMEVDPRSDEHAYGHQQPEAQMGDKAATSLSYPGAMPAPAPPHRVMSMPIPIAPASPNSSNKKHKCPYCDTEFTRHHNLKSHLLTHSQEKPYVCQSCQMRFRRLHDLKRHNKLHTGEKPHVCPSCDRKFARGDALARHSKGAGGCAGRRQTMASFSLKDGYDGSHAGSADNSAMSGDLYDGAGGADLSEEERRRLSMPSIKTQHVAGQAGGPEGYIPAAHSNTYPPAGPRPGGLYPPNADRGSSSSNTSPTSAPNSGHTPHTSISSVPLSAGSSSLFSQGGMTESPKPLSPGTGARPPPPPPPPHEQQQGAAAAAAAATTTVAGGLALPPSSYGTSSPAASNNKQAWLSQYPPADRNATAQGHAVVPPQQQPQQQQQGAHAAGVRGRGRAASGSAAPLPPPPPPPPPGASSENGSVASNSNGLAADPVLWAYFQHLEGTVKRLTGQVEAEARDRAALLAKLDAHDQHIAALTAEVAALRREREQFQHGEQGQGQGPDQGHGGQEHVEQGQHEEHGEQHEQQQQHVGVGPQEQGQGVQQAQGQQQQQLMEAGLQQEHKEEQEQV